MGAARNARRVAQRNNYFGVLSQHLAEYTDFLESQPQPSNEEVVKRFNKHNQAWINFCHQLNLSGSDLFSINVTEMWKRREAKVPASE